MATEQRQQDPLFEEEFSNWAKTVLSLQNARDGSINYIKSKMEAFVQELLRMHGSDEDEHFKELLIKVAVNGKVNESKKQLLPKDRFVLANNRCTTCNKVFEKQLETFEESRWHSKKWIHNSTEEQLDPSSYWWVVAKIYIAKPDIIDALRPEEVEPSAIFKLISNCKLFDDRNLNEWGEKLIKLRNKLVHSANNRMTKEEMKESFDLIKDFLKQVADNPTEGINEVEKLEKSTLVLFEENGEFSKLAKEALQLQNISLSVDLESPEGIKKLAIKSLGASNLEIKQQEKKFEESERKHNIRYEELLKEKEQQEIKFEESEKIHNVNFEKLLKEKEDILRRFEESEKKVDQYKMEVENASKRVLSKRMNDLEEKFETFKLTMEQRYSDQKEKIDRQVDELSSVKKNTEEQKKEIESQREELSSVKKNLSASHMYQELSRSDINVRVESDDGICNITDMCQMSDDTVVAIDASNQKLKRLDDNFNVRDFYQFDMTPLCIVPVSSARYDLSVWVRRKIKTNKQTTQVAILNDSWKIYLMTLGKSIVYEKRVDLGIKDRYECFGMEYCNNQFWICVENGIYIHSLSGSLVKYIENDSFSGPEYGQKLNYCCICTNKDKTRVYVKDNGTVYVFNTDGKVLFTFPIKQSSCPIITTLDNSIASCNAYYGNYHIDMYDVEGKIHGEIVEIDTIPSSLLYDEKKCCLIVGCDDGAIKVFQLQKQEK